MGKQGKETGDKRAGSREGKGKGKWGEIGDISWYKVERRKEEERERGLHRNTNVCRPVGSDKQHEAALL